jgi:hypothetical protein
MLHTVKKVKYLDGYKLELIFNDGKAKVVDFKERLQYAKNMFLPLRDVNYFKKVKSDGTTLVWPNGLDLCPDTLYEMGTEMQAPTKKTAHRHRTAFVSEKPNTPKIAAKSK